MWGMAHNGACMISARKIGQDFSGYRNRTRAELYTLLAAGVFILSQYRFQLLNFLRFENFGHKLRSRKYIFD